MRVAAIALLSTLALAACNPSAPAGGQGGSTSATSESGSAPSAGDSIFPNLTQAAYRAEATITGSNGRSMPVVMIRSGHKMRMEMSTSEGQSTVISNSDTGEAFMITNAAGQVMAMRMSGLNEVSNPSDAWSAELAATATPAGPCSAAGVNGTQWSRIDSGVTKTACVTSDGILLRATEGDRTVWETTSVQRGPQSDTLFTLPEGVRVVDLGNMRGVADALARAKSGDH